MRGLYAGFGSTLARNVPYNALHFGLFALIAAGLHARRMAAWLVGALAGALAGALTALVTTPLDLVNTRLQTQVQRSCDRESVGCTGTMPEACP